MSKVGMVTVALVAYLLGSLNFAIILSQPKGDIRNLGSGNAGMTNVLRVYGKNMAVLTALGDFLKAVAAVGLARYLLGPFFTIQWVDPGYIAGLFALLGHIFPLYFGFRGGKGVVTALGVLVLLDPLIFAILLAICLPLILHFRIVSLGSIVGASLFPLVTFLIRYFGGLTWKFETLFALLIGGIVVYMHRENISRLLQGKENQFERKPKNK